LRNIFGSGEGIKPSPVTNIAYRVFIYANNSNQDHVEITDRDIPHGDVDLKVSTITNKIDVKNKNIHLPDISISANNYPVYIDDDTGEEKRLSDILLGGIGRRIKVSMRWGRDMTSSMTIAEGRISRIQHDDNRINISANNVHLEDFHLDLPQPEYVLNKDVNTYEHYHDRPVPILYGHLKQAPSPVYLNRVGESSVITNQTIKLLPDNSDIGGSNIHGIKKFEPMLFAGINTDLIELKRQDNVGVKIGDNVCDVPCLPYVQTRSMILDDDHDYQQWSTSGKDYLSFNVIDDDGTKTHIRDDKIWCSFNQKPNPNPDDKRTFYVENNNTTYVSSPYSYEIKDITDSFKTSNNSRYAYRVGVQTFEFDPISGYKTDDRLKDDGSRKIHSDVHFIGSANILQKNFGGSQKQFHSYTWMFPVYSAPNLEGQSGSGGQETDLEYFDKLAFPKELHKLERSNGSRQIRGTQTWDLDSFYEDITRAYFRMFGFSEHQDDEQFNSYFTSFISGRFNQNSLNNFESRYQAGFRNLYPILDATSLAIYYFADAASSSSSNSPFVMFDIEAQWRDLELRKVWLNMDMFEKDYFLNAKGKVYGEERDVWDINGSLTIKYEGVDAPDLSNNAASSAKKDNLHFTELYKYLTDEDLKSRLIGNKYYEIMLMCDDGDEPSFLYDIEINNMKFCDGFLPYMWNNGSDPYVVDGEYVGHSTGWLVSFNSKQFGKSHSYQSSGNYMLTGVRLVYGRKKYGYEGNVLTLQEIEYQEAEELATFNDNNGYEFGDQTDDLWRPHGYTLVSYLGGNRTSSERLLENPAEIIKDLLNTQAESDVDFNDDKFERSVIATQDDKFAFSINKTENIKDIINNILKESRLYLGWNWNQELVIHHIKDEYNDNDVDGVIDVDNIYNCKFNLSNIEDLAIGGVEVKYGYNYATEKFDKTTDPITLGYFTEHYKQEYGIENEDDYKLVFESKYIQDKGTAEHLRNYLFHSKKHQQLTCSFDAPLSEVFEYEVGDIIMFSDNPKNTKPYGRDIKEVYTNIDQTIYPYFLITKTTLKGRRISIEAMQLRNLDVTEIPATLLGDVNLDNQVTWDDALQLNEMLFFHGNNLDYYYSPQQISNADMNQDGNIDVFDLIDLIDILEEPYDDGEYVDFASGIYQSSTDELYLTENQIETDDVYGMLGLQPYNTSIVYYVTSNLNCVRSDSAIASLIQDQLGSNPFDRNPRSWGEVAKQMQSTGSSFNIMNQYVKLKVSLVSGANIDPLEESTANKMLIFNNCLFKFDGRHSWETYVGIKLLKDGALSPSGNEIIWNSSYQCTIDGQMYTYGYVSIGDPIAKKINFAIEVPDNYWEE